MPPLCVQELHHKNRYWHEDCFRCAKCYKPLAGEAFNARDDGKIMCGKCGSREDGNRCQGCYKVVMPGGFAVILFRFEEDKKQVFPVMMTPKQFNTFCY